MVQKSVEIIDKLLSDKLKPLLCWWLQLSWQRSSRCFAFIDRKGDKWVIVTKYSTVKLCVIFRGL